MQLSLIPSLEPGQNPIGNCTITLELSISYLKGMSGIPSPSTSLPLMVDPETLFKTDSYMYTHEFLW